MTSFMEIIQFLPTLFLFIASFSFIIFISGKSKAKQPTINLPPGPVKLPFIGNLHNLIGALPHHALQSLAVKYGSVMHLQLGELSAVVISSADAAKQVLKTHDVNFASRPSIISSEIIMYGSKDMAFAPYGEHWKQLRKICALELFSHKRVQSFRFIREQVYSGLMDWITSNEGLPVDLTEKLRLSTFEVVSKCALGDIREGQDALVRVLYGILELASGFDMTDLFPSIGLLQKFSPSIRRLQKYHVHMDTTLEKIIQDRGVVDEKDKNEYILDTLLKYQQEGSEIHLSTESIKGVIMDIFLAGTEALATELTWALAEMMKNPSILEKAQQEVRRVFDSKGYVDESDMDQLKYLKCVINETLRLHPPAPLSLPRKCSQKCEIDGYEIMPGTKVIVNIWAINKDPLYWKNPNCFMPERFLDSEINYKGNNFEYIPFSAGRRMCPGMNIGIANIEVPLAMLLYHFNWTLPSGMKVEDMDMTEGYGLTVPMKKPLVLVPMSERPFRPISPNNHES